MSEILLGFVFDPLVIPTRSRLTVRRKDLLNRVFVRFAQAVDNPTVGILVPYPLWHLFQRERDHHHQPKLPRLIY